jgi:hypothetical protein
MPARKGPPDNAAEEQDLKARQAPAARQARTNPVEAPEDRVAPVAKWDRVEDRAEDRAEPAGPVAGRGLVAVSLRAVPAAPWGRAAFQLPAAPVGSRALGVVVVKARSRSAAQREAPG